MSEKETSKERLHLVTEQEAAQATLKHHHNEATSLAELLRPASRQISLPLRIVMLDIIDKHTKACTAFLGPKSPLDVLLAALDETYHKERERLAADGDEVLDIVHGYKLVADHYFDAEVTRERKKRPTHVAALEIDHMCKASIDVRDRARGYFKGASFFFSNLLEVIDVPLQEQSP